ncbi:MAG: amidohydrolase/deacetylase family metallohydrolase [Flavitalea sp.]
MKLLFVFMVSLLCTRMVNAQTYSIVIKDGNVIDPKNNIVDVMDVAINDGKIVKVAKNIDAKGAAQVIDAKGLYVTPGLIDIHTHDFFGTEPDHYLSNGLVAVMPDGFTFRVGVTTVVDAGGSGWKSFALFKKNIINNSQTRVLAMLNVVGEGMRGGMYEQNTKDMNPKMIAMVAKANRDVIVGIKVAHFEGHEWTAVDSAVVAGNMANIPVMVDFGSANAPLPIEELFMKHLRPGDIFTHCYGNLKGREAIVDETTNTVKPFVFEARKRGLFFDVGYGGISFRFSQAIPALKQGFIPTSISTDLHEESTNGAMKDQLTCMSKFLAMGMDLPAVIKASTMNPALEIKREDLGNLSVGSGADVAILNLRHGKFGYFDYTGYKISYDKKLECEMTIRAGRIVYDVNGIANPVMVPGKPAKNEKPSIH